MEKQLSKEAKKVFNHLPALTRSETVKLFSNGLTNDGLPREYEAYLFAKLFISSIQGNAELTADEKIIDSFEKIAQQMKLR